MCVLSVIGTQEVYYCIAQSCSILLLQRPTLAVTDDGKLLAVSNCRRITVCETSDVGAAGNATALKLPLANQRIASSLEEGDDDGEVLVRDICWGANGFLAAATSAAALVFRVRRTKELSGVLIGRIQSDAGRPWRIVSATQRHPGGPSPLPLVAFGRRGEICIVSCESNGHPHSHDSESQFLSVPFSGPGAPLPLGMTWVSSLPALGAKLWRLRRYDFWWHCAACRLPRNVLPSHGPTDHSS